MRANSLGSKLLRLLICHVFAVSAIIAPYEAHAIYDNARKNSFNSDTSSSMCNTSDGGKYLAFDPYGGNVDYEFDLLGNKVCAAISTSVGAATVATWGVVKGLCASATCPNNLAAALRERAQDDATGPLFPFPSPSWPAKLLIWSGACAARSATTAACCANPGTCSLGAGDATLCCAGAIAFGSAVASTMIALGAVYGKGHQAYDNARICGVQWNAWKQLDSEGNESENGIWTKVKGPYQLCLRRLFLNEENQGNDNSCGSDASPQITNKAYREFIYGGMEFEDNDSGSCENPTTWSDDRKNKILGYTEKKQRYYMTGPNSAPIYACHRFLAKAKSEGENDATADQMAMQEAYSCCKKRSQNAICIENRGGSKDVNNVVTLSTPYSPKFCEIGTKNCHVGDVDFEVYASTRTPNYICAKTYSACPYNHLLGGGTETKDEDEKGNLNNYCQYLKHCSKIPLLPHVRTSSLTNAYIDSSCQDLRGDTQNVYSYTAELLPIQTRGFTAPMAQCIKETMQNIFLNKAGYTKCTNPDEAVDQDGNCRSGAEFKKGQDIEGRSFFVKLQKNFQTLLKLVLTLSIILYGAMILFAVPKAAVERKSIFPQILKIALIAYFTLGTAWQDVFVKDLLGASSYLASITFRPNDTAGSINKQDGCQFPRYNYADDNETTKYENPAYPPGKEYLEVWDMLDCKIAIALGFGPEVSVPNLVFMILGGFITASYGLIFVIAAFSFAFFIIFVALRALQFFLVAMIAVVILLYASIFIIPLCLFKRTKGIFDSWWKQILTFTLQPMILMAYLGVLIAIFDNIVIGSATFEPVVVEINGVNVVDTYGRIAPKKINCNNVAKNDSIYCIFRIADIKNYNGLEALGIGLPMLFSVNTTKLTTLIKGALLMFIFSKFMDMISEIAATLTGGSSIGTGWSGQNSPYNLAAKTLGTLQGVQSRGVNSAKKYGGKAARFGQGFLDALSNKGKKADPVNRNEKLGDHTSNSDSGKIGEKLGDHTSNGDNGKRSDLTLDHVSKGKSPADQVGK
ncbi:MAG: type IV secretion system protein [Proteobacteria bacterium]|nr:type IV secretion system protein [Pseudomonadota bacterium]